MKINMAQLEKSAGDPSRLQKAILALGTGGMGAGILGSGIYGASKAKQRVQEVLDPSILKQLHMLLRRGQVGLGLGEYTKEEKAERLLRRIRDLFEGTAADINR